MKKNRTKFIVGRRKNATGEAFTLIELMVVISLMGILTVAVTSAFIAGIDTERTYAKRQQQQNSADALEENITRLIEGVKLSDATLATTPVDTSTYFLGGVTVGAGATTAAANAPGQSSTSSSSSSSGGSDDGGGGDLGCDRITFTTTALGVSSSLPADQDDFDTQQQNNKGPVGGLSEVSIGSTAQGDAGDKTGLFERVQRPSDGDSSQGGMESLLSANVKEIGFQFWDGTQWVSTWDSTTTPDTRRLPAAVQVSYILQNDASNTVHTFVVPIPASDVTALNPIATTS